MTKRGGAFVLFLLGTLIALVALFKMGGVFAYQTGFSHPALTQKAILLYNQAGVGGDISAQESSWIVKGAINEDTFPRYFNHFYDPIYNRPWLGGWNMTAEIAPAWAQDSVRQTVFTRGDQSWQKAVEAYAKGDLESSFVALGHILHLLEDMAVPEHTRNDTHIPYVNESFYEDWVERNTNKLKSPDGGATKFANLERYFYSLAVFSNQNFFSRDTIKSDEYLNPVMSDCPDNLRGVLSGGKILNYKCRGIGSGVFRLVQFKKIKNWQLNEVEEYVLDDELVLSDYFSILGPKAVSYGAGVIDLFFKEAERAKVEYEKKSWWQKLNPLATLLPEPGSDAQTESLNTSLRSTEQNNQGGQASEGSEAPKEVLIKTAQNQNLVVIPKASDQILPQPKTEEKTPLKQNPLVNPENNKEPDKKTEEKNQEELSGNTSTAESPFHPAGESPFKEQLNGSEEKEETNENPPDEEEQNEEPQEEEPSQEQEGITVKIDSAPAKTTSATFAVFEFSSSAASAAFQCKLDKNEYDDCQASKTYNGLEEGEHLFSVYAVDPQTDEISPTASRAWMIDLTGPQAQNIQTQNIAKNSARIGFETDEPAKFGINWGENFPYDQITSQSLEFAASHTYQLNELEAESEYHYQIITQDELGNLASSADNIFQTAQAKAEHLVISEIQVAGAGGANDEWIELSNPTEQAVDVSGWSIQNRGSAAENYQIKKFETGDVVPAKGFFLIAKRSGYIGSVEADADYTFSMSGNGGTVFFVGDQNELIASGPFETVVDRLAYGEGEYLFPEVAEFTPAPLSGQSLERKANKNSTAESLSGGADKQQGNAFDTDNNSQDFVLQAKPDPQNSVSMIEPREALSLEWSGKQKLEEEYINHPQIAVVSSDQQEVVWQRNSSKENLYGRSRESQAWGQGKTLISKDNQTKDKLVNSEPKLIANLGRVFSFFVAKPASPAKNTLFVSEKVEGEWSVPASVSFLTSGAQQPDLVLDHQNNLHLVWHDYTDAIIRYQKCALESEISCGEVELLGKINATNLRVVLDKDSEPHIFFHRFAEKDIRKISFENGSWSESLVVETDRLSLPSAQFAVQSDAAGGFHLVYGKEESLGAGVWDYFYLKEAGGAWLEEEEIEEGIGTGNSLEIAVDPTGVFVLSANCRPGVAGSYELNLWKKEAGVWLAPQKVPKENGDEQQFQGQLATDGSGKVYLVWKTPSSNPLNKLYYIEGV